jgi:hypothetical protein
MRGTPHIIPERQLLIQKPTITTEGQFHSRAPHGVPARSPARYLDLAEIHRPSEPGDPVRDPQLTVRGPFRLLLQDNRVVPNRFLQLGLHVFQPVRLPAGASCLRLWPGL